MCIPLHYFFMGVVKIPHSTVALIYFKICIIHGLKCRFTEAVHWIMIYLPHDHAHLSVLDIVIPRREGTATMNSNAKVHNVKGQHQCCPVRD